MNELQPEAKPETSTTDSIEAQLDEMISRRNKLGDYNADSADIRRICEILRFLMR